MIRKPYYSPCRLNTRDSLTNELDFYLLFNEFTGNTLYNNGYSASFTGDIIWANGCIYKDTSTNYFQTDYTPNDVGTISMRVFITTSLANNLRLWSSGTAKLEVLSYWQFYGAGFSILSPGLQTGVWTTVTCCWDTSIADTAKFYINGNLIGTDLDIDTTTYLPIKILANISGGFQFKSSYIDNFFAYRRCLSDNEVLRLTIDPYKMFKKSNILYHFLGAFAPPAASGTRKQKYFGANALPIGIGL